MPLPLKKSQDEIILTPKEYMELSEEEKSNIKSIRIVPPKLGDKHFGKILITEKIPTPMYYKYKNNTTLGEQSLDLMDPRSLYGTFT